MSENTIVRISRRQFLLGAGAVSLLGVLYTTYNHIGTYPATDLALRHLSSKEAAIYRLLGNWLIPDGGELPGSGGDDETLLRIDLMFEHIPAGKRQLLAALPLAFEHGTLLHNLGATALSNMPPKQAEEYLNEWSSSSDLIRCQLFAALKTMYAFSYFEREDVLQAMGLSALCQVPST